MVNPFTKLDFTRYYNMLATPAAIIFIASISVELYYDNLTVTFLSLAVLLISIGERANWTFQKGHYRSEELQRDFEFHKDVREPKTIGRILWSFGLLSLCLGLYRIAHLTNVF